MRARVVRSNGKCKLRIVFAPDGYTGPAWVPVAFSLAYVLATGQGAFLLGWYLGSVSDCVWGLFVLLGAAVGAAWVHDEVVGYLACAWDQQTFRPSRKDR